MRGSHRTYPTAALLGLAVLVAFTPGCSETPSLSFSLQPSRELPAIPPTTTTPSIAIQAPADGETIHEDVFDGMAGVVSGLQPGQQLFTFARDHYRNWFLQYPPIEAKDGRFMQVNIRLSTPGDDWELVVCVASAEASRFLHSCAKRGQYSFHASELPEGVQPVASVSVKRR